MIEPGHEPAIHGKVRVDSGNWIQIIVIAKVLAVPIVGLGRNGKETDASRIYRALKPLKDFYTRIFPPDYTDREITSIFKNQ